MPDIYFLHISNNFNITISTNESNFHRFWKCAHSAFDMLSLMLLMQTTCSNCIWVFRKLAGWQNGKACTSSAYVLNLHPIRSYWRPKNRSIFKILVLDKQIVISESYMGLISWQFKPMNWKSFLRIETNVIWIDWYAWRNLMHSVGSDCCRYCHNIHYASGCEGLASDILTVEKSNADHLWCIPGTTACKTFFALFFF